jgi:hypothetical protein
VRVAIQPISAPRPRPRISVMIEGIRVMDI